MADIYRHSIAELITRYELEPELRDIYVEGERDRHLISWFLSSINRPKSVVYSIQNAVHVPRNILLAHGGAGNRGRVIALCFEICAALPQANNILGVVDKDYSEILDMQPACRILAITDFSCMECYALSPEPLEKFFKLYLGREVSDTRMDNFFEVLTELFLLRAAKISLSGPASWIRTVTRLCTIVGGQMEFDRDGFVTRLLNAPGGQISRADFDQEVLALRSKLQADFRQQINGHDLIQLFSWLAHRMGVDHSIYNEMPLQRGLLACLEIEEMQNTVLFQRLAAWSV